jgi:hypothetical protein
VNYYLREINRSFANFILLGIEDDSFPVAGEPHRGLALARGCLTLDGIRWRKGDGRQLNGDEFESRHLGECKSITETEAINIMVDSEKEIEYKVLKSFVKAEN